MGTPPVRAAEPPARDPDDLHGIPVGQVARVVMYLLRRAVIDVGADPMDLPPGADVGQQFLAEHPATAQGMCYVTTDDLELFTTRICQLAMERQIAALAQAGAGLALCLHRPTRQRPFGRLWKLMGGLMPAWAA